MLRNGKQNIQLYAQKGFKKRGKYVNLLTSRKETQRSSLFYHTFSDMHLTWFYELQVFVIVN